MAAAKKKKKTSATKASKTSKSKSSAKAKKAASKSAKATKKPSRKPSVKAPAKPKPAAKKAATKKPSPPAKPEKAKTAAKKVVAKPTATKKVAKATPAKVNKANKKTASKKSKKDDGPQSIEDAEFQLNNPLADAETDADGEIICREVGCEGLAVASAYCRLHYIKNWKKIKRKEMILKEGKLNRYIEELVAKYPDKYIEVIRNDLADDKEFGKVVSDLELDESIDEFEIETDSVDSLIDSIRRDIDDDGDSY